MRIKLVSNFEIQKSIKTAAVVKQVNAICYASQVITIVKVESVCPADVRKLKKARAKRSRSLTQKSKSLDNQMWFLFEAHAFTIVSLGDSPKAKRF